MTSPVAPPFLEMSFRKGSVRNYSAGPNNVQPVVAFESNDIDHVVGNVRHRVVHHQLDHILHWSAHTVHGVVRDALKYALIAPVRDRQSVARVHVAKPSASEVGREQAGRIYTQHIMLIGAVGAKQPS